MVIFLQVCLRPLSSAEEIWHQRSYTSAVLWKLQTAKKNGTFPFHGTITQCACASGIVVNVGKDRQVPNLYGMVQLYRACLYIIHARLTFKFHYYFADSFEVLPTAAVWIWISYRVHTLGQANWVYCHRPHGFSKNTATIWHFSPAPSSAAIEGRGLRDHEFEASVSYTILLVWNLNNDRPPACKIEKSVMINWI